ncbi:MAG: PAS domain S-box protein, partial [Mycobacteriaceae bacterium]
MTVPDLAEQLRGPTLHRIGALNAGSDQVLDELTALAAQLCQVPMAMVSLFDAERQWCASSFGPELQGTAPEDAFCVRALGDAGVVVVPDATADTRFSSSPLVTGEPGVRFCAGAPLVTQEGNVLGALCVLDVAPRRLTAQHLAQLSVLARQIVSQLELRRQVEVLAMEVDARVAAEAALRKNQRLFDAVLENTDAMVDAKDLEDLSQTDGRVRRHHSTKFPLRDDEGRVYAIAGLPTDISALPQERKAHAASEQRWRDLVEQSSVAVAVIGADARFSYVNPQAVSLYGAEASEDLVGRLVFDFIADGAEPNASSNFSHQLGSGAAVLGRRWTVRRLDGLRVTLEVNSSAIMYGGHPAVQAELRDVTAEVAAETALRAAHTELADRQTFTDAVLDSIEVGIIACDVEGRLTVSNRASRAWFAVDPGLVPLGPDEGEPGRHGAAMGPDGHSLSEAELPLNRALAEGSIEDVEIVVPRPGLPEVRLLCAGRALSAPDGRPL